MRMFLALALLLAGTSLAAWAGGTRGSSRVACGNCMGSDLVVLGVLYGIPALVVGVLLLCFLKSLRWRPSRALLDATLAAALSAVAVCLLT